METMPLWLAVTEIVRFYNVPISTVYYRIEQGRLGHAAPGRPVRFKRAAVEKEFGPANPEALAALVAAREGANHAVQPV